MILRNHAAQRQLKRDTIQLVIDKLFQYSRQIGKLLIPIRQNYLYIGVFVIYQRFEFGNIAETSGRAVMVGVHRLRRKSKYRLSRLFHAHSVRQVHCHESDINIFQILHFRNTRRVAGNINARSILFQHIAVSPAFRVIEGFPTGQESLPP